MRDAHHSAAARGALRDRADDRRLAPPLGDSYVRAMRVSSRSVVAAALVALGMSGCSRGCARAKHHAPLIEPAPSDFFADRAAHPTHLEKHAPSPQEYSPWPTDGLLRVVDYPSGGRTLKGLLARPASAALARDGKSPVLIYLHGGFALGADDVAACLPFSKAGFLVWAPALRGENGNPGDHELAFGELDDARAALEFAKTITGADPSRMVTFGHSAGGMLSSLLALYPSLPVIDTGSAGGLYGPALFDGLPRPFVDDPIERRMRLFAPYVRQMKQPHFACVGDGDRFPRNVLTEVTTVATSAHLPLETAVVPGNHFGSLAACMEAYLARVLPKMQ
jgi:pimeloyl-ACP methyl ester carboxylesterase